jgi:hypothetical protein
MLTSDKNGTQNFTYYFDEVEMRSFSLHYKGALHSDQASDRARRKREIHDIRLAFHAQLPVAWRLNMMLRNVSMGNFVRIPYRGDHYLVPHPNGGTYICCSPWKSSHQ